MKRLFFPITISLFIHLGIITNLNLLPRSAPSVRLPFQLVVDKMVPDTPAVQPVLKTSRPQKQTLSHSDPMPDTVCPAMLPADSIPSTQIQTLSYVETRKARQDHLFLRSAKPNYRQPKQSPCINAFSFNNPTSPSVPSPGPVHDFYLNRDSAPLRASALPPPEVHEKIHKTDKTFLPDPNQCRILGILNRLNNRASDQLSLFIKADGTQPLTMALFLDQMDQLYKKGFVKRKKISPQNNFLFFGVPIEMSRKNKKNPVYQYELQIDADKLKRRFESEIDLLINQKRLSPADSGRLQSLRQCLVSIRG